MNAKESTRTGKHSLLVIILLTLTTTIMLIALLFAAFMLIGRENKLMLSSAYSYMEAFVDRGADGEFLRLTEEYVSRNITEFENTDEVINDLSELLSSDTLSFTEDTEHPENTPSFTVYSNGKAFFHVILSHNGKTFSGFDQWSVKTVTLSDRCEIGMSLSIEAPHGAVVTVNGTELPTAGISAEKTDYFALTEFEKDLADTIYCDRYEIGIFFGTPDTTAVLDGRRLIVTDYEKGVIRFSYPPSVTNIYTLTVPYGSSVTVNDISLGSDYITKTGLKYPFLTRFEEKLTKLPAALTYQISGLFHTPQISVTYNGIPLEDSGKNRYRLPSDMTKSYKIYAPSDAVVKLNGVSLGQSEITAEEIDLPILQGVTNYVKDRPYLTEYTVSGLLTTPEITVSDANGKALKTDIYHSDENSLCFLYTSSPEPPEKDIITLKAFARYYVKYFYSGSEGLKDNYSNITAMTPAKSLAFSKLKNEYKTIYQSDICQNIKFGECEYYDYSVYSNTAFSCMVKLPFTALRNGETVSEEITLQILYIYSGNIRRVINYLAY